METPRYFGAFSPSSAAIIRTFDTTSWGRRKLPSSALFASGFLAPAFLLHLFLLLDSEEFAPAVEILFHNQTETLSVEAVSGEIAVVGLIIHAHGEITVREDEITEIEVADKTLCGIRIVAIAKLSVDEQTVIEKRAIE